MSLLMLKNRGTKIVFKPKLFNKYLIIREQESICLNLFVEINTYFNKINNLFFSVFVKIAYVLKKIFLYKIFFKSR